MIDLGPLSAALPEALRRKIEQSDTAQLLAEAEAAIERQRVADHAELAAERDRINRERAERSRPVGMTTNLPQCYQHLRFVDVPARTHATEAMTKGHAHVVAWAQRFVEKFGEVKGNSMVMLGNSGAGKTSLACAMANELDGRGLNIQYMTANEYFETIRNSFGRKDKGKGRDRGDTQSISASVNRADLLILDEVGRGYNSDAEKSWLFDLIDLRHRSERSLVLISNLTRQQLVMLVGVAGERRLMGRCHQRFHEFTWGDLTQYAERGGVSL